MIINRRDSLTGSNDLNVVYRPCRIEEMLGNATSKKIIKNALDSQKVHHTQLYTGNAGCGKTTAARIVALGLNCKTNGVSSEPCLECSSCRSIMNGHSIDVKEINVGQSGGKGDVDAIVKDLPLAPFNTRYKVLIFDEAHELTTAAKNLLLLPIEAGYEHVYFIFCTNQPEKLVTKKTGADQAFLERCFSLDFRPVEIEEIRNLIQNICEFEGFMFNKDVLDLIAEESKGVPRKAIMWLNKVSSEGSWTLASAKEILKMASAEDEPAVIELCRALNKGSWLESVKIFDSIKTVPIETIRISASGYFVSCLKRSKKVGEARKYSAILDIVTTPIFEQGKLAEHKWYNYMFKIVDTVALHKGRN